MRAAVSSVLFLILTLGALAYVSVSVTQFNDSITQAME